MDLENWVTALPDNILTKPIVNIAIPGSHNSCTYSITSNSDVSPDSTPTIQWLANHGKKLVRWIMSKWARNQAWNITQQLQGGIRYLDLRVVVKDGLFYTAHGLYGCLLESCLVDVSEFFNNHPKEIVILDFQHFYEFRQVDHEMLLAMIENIFGSKICKRQASFNKVTIKNMWNNKEQVFIIYRDGHVGYNLLVWPSQYWPTPWPNVMKVDELFRFLDSGLDARTLEVGFVTQCVLTPSTQYVALHLYSSLKALATRAKAPIITWISNKESDTEKVNVIICDFIDFNFVKSVVLLNYELNTKKALTQC